MVGMYEAFQSRETVDPVSDVGDKAVLRYILDESNDENTVRTYLKANAPPNYYDLVAQTYEVEPLGPSLWQGQVTYGAPDDYLSKADPQTGEAEYSFDTSGGTTHITQSLANVGKYSNHANGAEDYGGAIEVNGEGEPEGVDIVVPALSFTIKAYIAGATVTTAYVQTLASLTGRMNAGAFNGFAAGELLFMGAMGNRRGRGDWEITFRFSAGKNVTGLSVGGITVSSKLAHDYLWCSFEKQVDGGAKRLVPKVRSVYVERVYQPGNFSQLQIPSL